MPRLGHLHTFATACTGVQISPGLFQIGDDTRLDASPHHIPGMRTFNLIADTYNGYTHTAVRVKRGLLMRGIHISFRIKIGQPNMIDTHFDG